MSHDPTGPDTGCERWEALQARRAEGEEPSADDLRFEAAHLAECESCRMMAEAGSVGRLDSGARPLAALDQGSRRQAADAVLRRRKQGTGSPAAGPGSWLPWAVGLAALAAVAVAALWLHEPAPEPTSWVLETTGPGRVGRLALTGGEVRCADRPCAADSHVAAGEVVEVADKAWAALLFGPSMGALLEERSRLRVDWLGQDGTELFLDGGAMLAVVDKEYAPARVVVGTGRGQVRVRGTVFAVTDAADGSTVHVVEGRVGVSAAGAGTRTVDAGLCIRLGQREVLLFGADEASQLRAKLDFLQQVRAERRPATLPVLTGGAEPRGEEQPAHGRTPGSAPTGTSAPVAASDPAAGSASPGRIVPEHRETAAARAEIDSAQGQAGRIADEDAQDPGSMAAQMLQWAHRLRGNRDWARSAAAYRELLDRYPWSADACAALVFLGDLELERLGSPRYALRSYEAHLKCGSGGALAARAALGRARALRSLGETAAEAGALRAFLRDHADSDRAGRARQRLQDLERAPPIHGEDR